MLLRLRLGYAHVAAALVVLAIPLAALAQAALAATPESVQLPTSWREALWTVVILPVFGLLWRELQLWLAARRQTAQATRDQTTRAYVEDLLFRLVDALGAPIMADLRPLFARVTDPAGDGGAAITRTEFETVCAAVERELHDLLTPDKLALVMKVIGLPAAARLVATWLLKRAFAVRQTAADPATVTDPGMALYGVRGATDRG